jgi:hypothetical protein
MDAIEHANEHRIEILDALKRVIRLDGRYPYSEKVIKFDLEDLPDEIQSLSWVQMILNAPDLLNVIDDVLWDLVISSIESENGG